MTNKHKKETYELLQIKYGYNPHPESKITCLNEKLHKVTIKE